MATVAELADRRLSYREVGATGTALPDGYRHLARNVAIGRSEAAFDRAATHLMTFGMHRDAGFDVSTSAPRAATGVDVLLRRGTPPLAFEAPLRIVHAVEQTDRHGFTYGTLTGHPARGEESFSVLLEPDGTVRFVLIAFSTPASFLATASGPLGRWLQDRIVDRYVAALRTVAGR
ncbi:MAG: DUF1990 domain-containing protein [Ilumatobacteraceae bacterium]|jgi:uncharacterized protein (UPF0548 family)|nr:DUF1990 domain-containing protein [Ilumatobacteraceae bacterium]